jgi:hypothetical protein
MNKVMRSHFVTNSYLCTSSHSPLSPHWAPGDRAAQAWRLSRERCRLHFGRCIKLLIFSSLACTRGSQLQAGTTRCCQRCFTEHASTIAKYTTTKPS